ncbi:MAG TPA: VTT domain-containing protein [Anaerolineales bacterium]|nr:VTT domain-containing protein [Anaerolineales bacterium]
MSPSKNPSKKPATKKNKKAQAKPKRTETPAPSSRASAEEPEQTVLTEIVQPTAYNRPGSSRFLTNMLRILALFAVVGITLYIYSIRNRVEQFAGFGYPGIFLIALLANATVLLPAPGVAVIYAMGAIFNPFGVGLAAGLGGTIGELSGYLAGFGGQAVVERMDIYNRIKPWVDKYGGWSILVLSAIPNPFFDIAGIAAGIAKMPVQTFLLFSGIGQLIKMTAFALAGHYSISWLSNFFE